MKQKRLFQVAISDDFKRGIAQLAHENKCAYGVFFSTSGKACVERVNPRAHYSYVWRTDRDVEGA